MDNTSKILFYENIYKEYRELILNFPSKVTYRNVLIICLFIQCVMAIIAPIYILVDFDYLFIIINVLIVISFIYGLYGSIKINCCFILIHSILSIILGLGFIIYNISKSFINHETNGKSSTEYFVLCICCIPYLFDIIMGIISIIFYSFIKNNLNKMMVPLLKKKKSNKSNKNNNKSKNNSKSYSNNYEENFDSKYNSNNSDNSNNYKSYSYNSKYNSNRSNNKSNKNSEKYNNNNNNYIEMTSKNNNNNKKIIPHILIDNSYDISKNNNSNSISNKINYNYNYETPVSKLIDSTSNDISKNTITTEMKIINDYKNNKKMNNNMIIKNNNNNIENVNNYPLYPYDESNNNNESINLDQNKMCIICHMNQRDIAFEPCGHVICCHFCIEDLNKKPCPICKQKIKKNIKLFI